MGIYSVGSFPVQSGGSLIFQLFRCRNLALNRFFSTFLEAGMFYTWGVSGFPLCSYTSPYICMAFCTPLWVQTPPMSPILCASVCSGRLLHVVGGCKGPLHVGHLPYTSPCMGVPPHVLHPHSLVGFPVHLCVLGIPVCDMGNISLMLGV